MIKYMLFSVQFQCSDVEFQEVAKNFDSLITSNFDADLQTIEVLLEYPMAFVHIRI